VYKFSLIDLEALAKGDRAEGASHRERLSERTYLGYGVDREYSLCYNVDMKR